MCSDVRILPYLAGLCFGSVSLCSFPPTTKKNTPLHTYRYASKLFAFLIIIVFVVVAIVVVAVVAVVGIVLIVVAAVRVHCFIFRRGRR